VSPKELKSAYHKLVRLYHPDVHPNHQDIYIKKMQQVNIAYDYLSKKLTENLNASEVNKPSDQKDEPNDVDNEEMQNYTDHSGYRWDEMKRTTSYTEEEESDSKINKFVIRILNLPLIIFCSCMYLPYSLLFGYLLLIIRYYYTEQNSKAKRQTEMTIGIMLLISVSYFVYLHM
jgi:hypothetical protein